MKKVLGKHIIKRVYVKRLGGTQKRRCNYYWGSVKLPCRLGRKLWNQSQGFLWRKIG